MPVAQITVDIREAGEFDEQYDRLAKELRRHGFVVSTSTSREHDWPSDTTETTIHLIAPGADPAEISDEVSDIRRAALSCLQGTQPHLSRRLLVFGPQGQQLLELSIPPSTMR
jgi:hypothetical protein